MIIRINPLAKTPTNKFIFLDRDGTINVEVNYLHELKHLRFENSVFDALRLMISKGYTLVIVTNQSGIGRGFYTESDFHLLQHHITQHLRSENIEFLGYAACPHFLQNCNCRKPKTALLDHFIDTYELLLHKSWMVGDKASDVAAGSNAGLNSALVMTGHGKSERDHLAETIPVFSTLYDFAANLGGTNELIE